MDDQRRPSGHSSPTSVRLPSFRSLSSNVSHSRNAPQARRSSIHDSSADDSHSLIQQIHERDQTIALLRNEQDRLQKLCEQLEMRTRVMDQELANLNEERSDLRNQASNLASQVEKLTREKEELQKQSQADAAQWRQIMRMSSRLQMQNVEETRRFNADREAWSREKEELEQRLMESWAGSPRRIDKSYSPSVTSELRRSSTLSSVSGDQLQQEVSTMRERYVELEELLATVLKESASIERAGTLLMEARKRMMVTDASKSASSGNSGDISDR